MPIFDYKCEKCGQLSSFLENKKKSFLKKLIGEKCSHCGHRKLIKQYSPFSTSKTISQNELLNDISKVAPINFVPTPHSTQQSPPNGCPYRQND